MIRYQVPREETSITLTNISEQVYWEIYNLCGIDPVITNVRLISEFGILQ